MGKITQRPPCSPANERLRTELKESKGRLKRKRRRKDLDELRRNVLETRKKLRKKAPKSRGTSFTKLLNKFADKRQENDAKTQPADGQDQRGARICNRLLPKSTIGIFTHGARGKEIRKANLPLNELDEARLQGNVFKLVNGDESRTKDGLADEIFGNILNRTTVDSSSKNDLQIVKKPTAKASTSLEKKHRKKHEVGKERQEDVLEHLVAEVNESERPEAQAAARERPNKKGPKCKRRLFQGRKDDNESNDRANSERSPRQCSSSGNCARGVDRTADGENCKTSSSAEDRPINYQEYCWSPISRYKQLAALICAENFNNQDFLKDNPSETLTKIKDRLKIHLRGDGSHAHRTKIKRYLHGSASSSSRSRQAFFPSGRSCMEVQACTYSDDSDSSGPRHFQDPNSRINYAHAEDCEEAILQKGEDLVSIIPANREAEQIETAVNDLPITCLPSALFAERVPDNSQDNPDDVVEQGAGERLNISTCSSYAQPQDDMASFAANCDSASLKCSVAESDVTLKNSNYLLARYLKDAAAYPRRSEITRCDRNLSKDDCEIPLSVFKASGKAREATSQRSLLKQTDGKNYSRHVPAILRRPNNNNFVAKTDGPGLIDNANPSDEECRVVFAKLPPGKNALNQDAENFAGSAGSWRSLRKEDEFLQPNPRPNCQRDLQIISSNVGRRMKRSSREESFLTPGEFADFLAKTTNVQPSYPTEGNHGNRILWAENNVDNVTVLQHQKQPYYEVADSEFTVQLVKKNDPRPDNLRTKCTQTSVLNGAKAAGCNAERHPSSKNLPVIHLHEEPRESEDILLFETASQPSRDSRGGCHHRGRGKCLYFEAPCQSLPDDKRLEYFARQYRVQGTASKPQTSMNVRFSDKGDPPDASILNSVQNLQFLTLEGSQGTQGVADVHCTQPDKYLAYENGQYSERIPVYLHNDSRGVKTNRDKPFPRVILVSREGSECDDCLSYGQKNRADPNSGAGEYLPANTEHGRERTSKGEVLLQVQEPSQISSAVHRSSVPVLQCRIRDRSCEGHTVTQHDVQQETGCNATFRVSGMQDLPKPVRLANRKIGVLIPKGSGKQSFVQKEIYLSRANQVCNGDGRTTQFAANGMHPQSKYPMNKEMSAAIYTVFPNSNL